MKKSERIQRLKEEKERIEYERFMNEMIDGWHSENYSIAQKCNARLKEIEDELSHLES